jgi:class 3 adenylate cyclase
MKKSVILICISCLLCNPGSFAQPLSKTDSAIWYIQKVTGNKADDSVLIARAVSYIKHIPPDSCPAGRFDAELKRLYRTLTWQNYFAVKTAVDSCLIFGRDADRAISYSTNLLNEMMAHRNEFDKTLLLNALEQARIPYRNSNRIQYGIAFFQGLISDFEQVSDSDALNRCYRAMTGYYRALGLLDKSIYYYKKSASFINRRTITGLKGYINRKMGIGSMLIDNEEPQKAFSFLYEAKRYFEAIQDSVVDVDGPYIYLQIIRAKMEIGGDSVFYYFMLMKNLLDRMRYLEADYTCMYNQLFGYYHYLENRPDSAEFYITRSASIKAANKLMTNSFVGELIPGYYLALVRINQSRYGEAVRLLREESSELLKVNLRRMALKEFHLLAVALKLNGELASANTVLDQYIKLNKEVIDGEKKNRSVSFETEQQIYGLNAEKQKQEREVRRQKLIRTWITWGIVFLFIFSLIFLYQRIRIAKEKKRSEALLLNILPSETAKELKETGRSEAKMYDYVTVMFSDFKGFTQISEKLTPSELVAEIDACFSSFDEIMTRHNIEKIKTIGDSYMCAGGLPVPDSNNASAVVSAALEIRDFMVKRKSQPGNPGFEIRIGIHTGSVVAGIVGTKKFAYDIWGDTVNTASRMESSGEAGKVNISQTTYDFIRDNPGFVFEYRGKITAKSKGEIDMFFVDRKRD